MNLKKYFSNLIFLILIFTIIFFIFFASYRIIQIHNDIKFLNDKYSYLFYFYNIILGIIFLILLLIGFKKLNDNLKFISSFFLCLFFTTLIVSEIYLEFYKKLPNEIAAKKLNLPYDARSKIEVKRDLINSGLNVISRIAPENFFNSNGIKSKNGRIYPLGTISNSKTIHSTWSSGGSLGFYPIFIADEHGFYNKQSLYNKKKVDIFMTGNSYSEGFSVDQNETISSHLEKLNFNVVNTSMAGNGPILKYANIKEYGEFLKPNIILWFFEIGDLNDIKLELSSPEITKYINLENYSQNLISRQEEIDNALKMYEAQIREKQKKILEKFSNKKALILDSNGVPIQTKQRIFNVLKITRLRDLINYARKKDSPTSLHIFKQTLIKTTELAKALNSKIYFINLPNYERYSSNSISSYESFVLKTVNDLKIPLIDIHDEVFKNHHDSLSLFPYKLQGNYTKEAYSLIATAIKRRIELDGYIYIKKNK